MRLPFTVTLHTSAVKPATRPAATEPGGGGMDADTTRSWTVLFLAQMEVSIPHDADPELVEQRKQAEKERAQELQRDGRWRHLWRVVGRYANVSILDVDSHEELHELLSTLPLFPYLDITITPLTRHPSALPDAEV